MQIKLFNLITLLFLISTPIQKSRVIQVENDPELLSPEMLSKDQPQWNNYFNRNRQVGFFTIMLNQKTRIIYYPYENGAFTTGSLLPFDDRFNYSDPWVNSEGDYMLLQADKDKDGNRSSDMNICESYYTQNGWTEPSVIERLQNFKGNEGSPSMTKNGNLYFNAMNTSGDYDIYLLKKNAKTPVPLSNMINSQYDEGDFYIDENEKFIVISSSGRSDSRGETDLYVSFNTENGWTPAVPFDEKVNSAYEEFSPYISVDRTKLVFTSNRQNPNTLIPSYNHFIVDIDMDQIKVLLSD